MSNRATQFVSYITPIRERVFAGLARAVGIALCLERGVAFDETADVYEVQGGAALPLDKAAMVGLMLTMLEAGTITRADVVQALQGMGVGLPPEAEPVEYAERALIDKERADNALADSIRGITEARGAVQRMGVDDGADNGSDGIE